MKLNSPLVFSLYAISLYVVATGYLFLTDAPAKIGFWMTLCSAFVAASVTTAALYYALFVKPKRQRQKAEKMFARGASEDGDGRLKK